LTRLGGPHDSARQGGFLRQPPPGSPPV